MDPNLPVQTDQPVIHRGFPQSPVPVSSPVPQTPPTQPTQSPAQQKPTNIAAPPTQPVQTPVQNPPTATFAPTTHANPAGGIDAMYIPETVTTLQQPEIIAAPIKSPEVVPQSLETVKPVETLPQAATPIEQQTTQQTMPQQQFATLKEQPNIVDQTEVKTQLHHINDTRDSLTSLADKEEEEFIEHVESAHGVK